MFILPDEFANRARGLPKEIQAKLWKCIALLQSDFRHPSLRAERVESAPRDGIFECWVDKKRWIRLIYERTEGGELYLWTVGREPDALRRARTLPVPDSSTPALESPIAEELPAPTSESARQSRVKDIAECPFAAYSEGSLVFLGVPQHQVSAVQQVTIDKLETLDLPSEVEDKLLTIWAGSTKEPSYAFEPSKLRYQADVRSLQDYCKGRIKRLLLALHPDQQRFIVMKSTGPILLRGVVGSGKTTLGVYRARHLAQQTDIFSPLPRVLFITYTKTLARVIAEFLEAIHGYRPPNIEVRTLHSWASRYLSRQGIVVDRIVKDQSQAEFIRMAVQTIQTKFPGARVFQHGEVFFGDEIKSVIKGRGVFTLQEYLRLSRVGRGSRLNAEDRHIVWSIYEEYQRLLRAEGAFDYDDLPILAVTQLAEDTSFQPYDHIIVDEAQDLTPVQLKVAQLAAGKQQSLFILADGAQSIYHSGFRWKDVGLHVVGRSFTLATNYRNTKEILLAAHSLMTKSQVLVEEGEIIKPKTSVRSGPKPLVVPSDSEWGEGIFTARRIFELCKSGQYRPGDIAVLARFKNQCEAVSKALFQGEVPHKIYTEKDFAVFEDCVKVITLHSAKGLEFPVVFIAGVNRGVLPYLKKTIEPGDQAEQIEMERRLLYVGMTRAADELYLVYTKNRPSPFLADIDVSTYRTL